MEKIMTKREMIEALNKGEKVRHRFFSENEWMKRSESGHYEFEDGVVVSRISFWQDRQGKEWENDWTIIN